MQTIETPDEHINVFSLLHHNFSTTHPPSPPTPPYYRHHLLRPTASHSSAAGAARQLWMLRQHHHQPLWIASDQNRSTFITIFRSTIVWLLQNDSQWFHCCSQPSHRQPCSRHPPDWCSVGWFPSVALFVAGLLALFVWSPLCDGMMFDKAMRTMTLLVVEAKKFWEATFAGMILWW